MLLLQAHEDHAEFLYEETDSSNQKAYMTVREINNKRMSSHHMLQSQKPRFLLGHN